MNISLNNSKTVAVTGASGLLGRHLCNYFNKKGWQVHALVRNVSGTSFKQKGITVYRCDLPEVINHESIENMDVLIHCAYMTRFTDIERAKKVNEEGAKKLYEAAKELGVKQFVFVSSWAARSSAKSYYALSKYKLEKMLDLKKDLVIRPGLILASDGGLFNRIVNPILKLPVIPAFDGGRQKMNTVHVNDLCRVFEWAVRNKLTGIISVAESESIEMIELYRSVLRELGQKKVILPVPGKPFVLLLQLLELLKLKLPVSSENLRGLLNRDNMDFHADERLQKSGIEIMSAHESIKALFSELN